MKKITLITLSLILALTIIATSCNSRTKPKHVELKTYADSLSYAIGYVYGLDIAMIPYPFNMNMIFRGLVNAADPDMEILSFEQINDLWNRLSDDLAGYFTDDNEELFMQNVEEGKLYMQANAEKAGVVTTDSGLQYRVITAGNGRRTRENCSVIAHYTGKFISGEVFDSSRNHGEPMSFDINMVIEGWTEALLLMREGDVYEIVIPYELAYGEMGYDVIEPGATLIFEIELLEVLNP